MRGQRRRAKLRDEHFDVVRAERILAELASRQDGVVGRAQLIARGFGRDVIDRLVAAGLLIPLLRGVYAVGHRAVSERGRMRAALLAAGDGAFLSHATAARAWALIPGLSAPSEVTLVGRAPRSRPGLRVHTVRRLDQRDLTILDGLAVTGPARTLLDLATSEAAWTVEHALREARVRRLLHDGDVEAAIARAPAQHGGASRLRALSGSSDAAPTRSVLERTLLRLIDDAGLPRPLVNQRHGRALVDFTWPEQRVIVEVDGWAAHGDRRAFEDDRARDAERQAQGYVVLRFTWKQVIEQPLRVAARIAQTLGVRTPS
jgi:very-short-patch-repair endonuclease